MFLNVCGFKLINEQYTTEGGNRLLCHLYRTLERSADHDREEFAARGESDHFFLCLREHDPQTIQLRLDQVIREINASQAADLPALPITVRSGVCLVEDPGQDITILQDHARLASQNPTPDHSRLCAFYDDSLTDRLRLEQELNTLFDSSLAVSYTHLDVYKRQITVITAAAPSRTNAVCFVLFIVLPS